MENGEDKDDGLVFFPMPDSGLGFLISGKDLSLQQLIRAHTVLQP